MQGYLSGAERIVQPLEEPPRLLVVPVRVLELAQHDPHLHPREERTRRVPGVVGPLRRIPGLGEVLEPVLRADLSDRYSEVVQRPGKLGPVPRRAEPVDRSLVPLDPHGLHLGPEKREGVADVDR